MTTETFRSLFPALRSSPDIVYLDSASTTQTPEPVVETVAAWLRGGVASPGRGAHSWSTRAERVVSQVRERTAGFIGAPDPEGVVFTSGATAGLNAVALSWGLANLADGDEILYNPVDHSSNVLPWINLQRILARFGRRLVLVPYESSPTGTADLDDLLAKVSARTRLITTAHVHNVFGSVTTLASLRGRIDDSIRLCFDASQSVGHLPVDVADLHADFLTFSAHKMFGLPGTGVVYFSPRIRPELSPFLPGGGSGAVPDNGLPGTVDLPAGLEGGTPNLPGIVALGAAIGFLDEIGPGRVGDRVWTLTGYLIQRLRATPGITLLPGPARSAEPGGYGIASLSIDGVRADEVGFALASRGIYVRAGNHCLPDGNVYGDSVRISLHLYNSIEDVDRAVDFLALISKGCV